MDNSTLEFTARSAPKLKVGVRPSRLNEGSDNEGKKR